MLILIGRGLDLRGVLREKKKPKQCVEEVEREEAEAVGQAEAEAQEAKRERICAVFRER